MQSGQGLLGRRDACAEIDHLLGQRIEAAGGIDHQIAHLRERLALRVEFAVGLGGGHDHPGQQIAALLRGFGHRVIEDVAHVEGLGQCGLGGGDRGAERRGVLLAELLDGQRQFVLAGAHRVVDLDHDGAGELIEGVQRNRRQRGRIGRVDALRGREIGLLTLALAPPRPQQQPGHRQRDDAQYGQHSEPVELGSGPR